ncbi:MAG: hypothetical protein M1816_000965 [Peltula sp. TS41687]|nr:MAG: hypothetical protein M1816_000965 [Peltula sp. TS41687]
MAVAPSSSSADAITLPPAPTKSDSQTSGSQESEFPSSTSGSKDDSPSGSQTADSNSTSTIEIDPRLPAGGVQMITPAPTAGPQYYKIGDKITFGWNYTSLSVTPTAIDIMASCTENHKLYTIAQNRSVESSQAITWDTQPEASANTPLVMAKYTLLVYDAAKGVSATPSPGYLGSYDQFTFGMYSPKPYTPAPAYQCASCSGAASQHANLERQALGFMFGMVVITVTSFTWFVSGVLF